ncbi:unnamed protein product [Heligmosomoides polygyrus]|uniref:AAA_12 domain-containing protein n=1 Tax=Heligmosomoides polygyrus TaxID=6339 RepID=A0A183GDH5_HELPZ|nr:unnamed protein product [Heligmosomoides polygyrus]
MDKLEARLPMDRRRAIAKPSDNPEGRVRRRRPANSRVEDGIVKVTVCGKLGRAPTGADPVYDIISSSKLFEKFSPSDRYVVADLLDMVYGESHHNYRPAALTEEAQTTVNDMNTILKRFPTDYAHVLTPEVMMLCKTFRRCRKMVERLLFHHEDALFLSQNEREEYRLAEKEVSRRQEGDRQHVQGPDARHLNATDSGRIFNGLLSDDGSSGPKKDPDGTADYDVPITPGVERLFLDNRSTRSSTGSWRVTPTTNKKIDLYTVDSVQGREKDIVILFTTRSHFEADRAEFLDDLRRMNVAITRSKPGIIILGRERSLPACRT